MFPYNEEERLAALAASGLLAARADGSFARMAEFVRSSFDVSMTAISSVEREQQTLFATCGLDAGAIPRDLAFCSRTVALDRTTVILDASLEPRWADNPLVTSGPEVRFYAGVPLRMDGHVVGTLCILDPRPRNRFSPADRQRLEALGELVVDMVRLHASSTAREAGAIRFECMAETIPDAMIVSDEDGRIVYWNSGATRIFGHDAAEAEGMQISDLLPPRFRYRSGDFAAMFDEPVGHTRQIEALAKDGRTFTVEFSLTRWREDGRARYGAVVRDVSARVAAETTLHELAHRDSLTGLPNRTVLMSVLGKATSGDDPTGVLLVDLDGFKEVNDRLGHAAGDDVLRTACARLLAAVSPTDVVARLGGDEFVVVVEGCADPLRLSATADAIVAAMEEPFAAGEQHLNLGASVGIALSPSHARGADELLSIADLALYQAKREGRHRHRLYSPVMRAATNERRRYGQDIRRAVEDGEFVLHYQPQVTLADGAVTGAEALLRWRHPEHGLLSPGAFLSTVENSRHVVEVGDWVLRAACRQAAEWRRAGHEGFKIGVNTFASQFRGRDFAEVAMRALDDAGLPPGNLEVEITENIILGQGDGLAGSLAELRRQGVSVAFDDYGTGFASLSLLKDYPLTRLKIDQSFVREMTTVADVAIIRAILDLASAFKLDVIAEGIETEDQVRRLLRKGCREGQGYLFGKPMPAADFNRLLHPGEDLAGAA